MKASRRSDFTVANFDQRLESAGDPWRGLRTAKGPDLDHSKRATETTETRSKRLEFSVSPCLRGS